MNPRHNKPAEAGLVHHRGDDITSLTIGANKRSVSTARLILSSISVFPYISISPRRKGLRMPSRGPKPALNNPHLADS